MGKLGRFWLVLVGIAALLLVLAVGCEEEEGEAPTASPAVTAEETPLGPGPGEGSELPSIPTYPGASEVLTGTLSGVEAFPITVVGAGGFDPEDYGTVQYTTYETSDSPGKVADFYKKEFKDWKEEWAFTMEGIGDELVVWSKGDGDFVAWLQAFQMDRTTSVVIAIAARQE